MGYSVYPVILFNRTGRFHSEPGTVYFSFKPAGNSVVFINGKEFYKLFIFPFTDATSGEESYINGRYIDLSLSDIKNDKLIIDFNFAYNPYCAYVSNLYNCPIPPKENDLPVAIRAGEKTFPKSH